MSLSFTRFSTEKRLAYHISEGRGPCVVFLGGFRSDMTGTKALALEIGAVKKDNFLFALTIVAMVNLREIS